MNIEMNLYLIINIITVFFILIMLIKGYKNGLLLQLVNVAGVTVACSSSWYLNPILCDMFDLWPHKWNISDGLFEEIMYNYFNKIAWYIAVVAFIMLILLLIRPLLSFLSDIPVLKQVNGLAGAFFGLVLSVFWIYAVCLILNLPFIKNGNEIINKTILGNITNVTTTVISAAEKPLKESEMFSKIINGEINTEEDREWLMNFMIEHDLDDLPIESFTQGEDNE